MSEAVFINDEDKNIFLLLLVFGFVYKTLELVATITLWCFSPFKDSIMRSHGIHNEVLRSSR